MKRILKGTVIFALTFTMGCAILFPEQEASSPDSVVSQRRVAQLDKSNGHTDEILLISPLPGKKSFVTASKDGQVLLWAGSPPRALVLYKHPLPIEVAAFYPESKLLALSAKSIIYIIDLETGEVQYKLDRIRARHLDLEFTPDGKALYFGATDNNIYRWKFISEKKAQTLLDREKAFERYNGPALPVSQVAVHQNGRIFFSGDWNGSVEGWLTYDSDRHQGYWDDNLFGPQFFSNGVSRVKFPRADHEAIDQLRLSPDGTLLFSASKTGLLELFKVRGLKKAAALQDHAGDVYSMAVSPDGSRVVTAGRDEFVHVVKIHRNTEEELKAKADRSFDYDLTIEREIRVPDIMVVAFQGPSSILAGNKTGAVLQIQLDQMTLMPTPTPTHTPRSQE